MTGEDNCGVMLCKLPSPHIVLNLNEYNTEYTSHNSKVTSCKSKLSFRASIAKRSFLTVMYLRRIVPKYYMYWGKVLPRRPALDGQMVVSIHVASWS